jgi:hypothetical protein
MSLGRSNSQTMIIVVAYSHPVLSQTMKTLSTQGI